MRDGTVYRGYLINFDESNILGRFRVFGTGKHNRRRVLYRSFTLSGAMAWIDRQCGGPRP